MWLQVGTAVTLEGVLVLPAGAVNIDCGIAKEFPVQQVAYADELGFSAEANEDEVALVTNPISISH